MEQWDDVASAWWMLHCLREAAPAPADDRSWKDGGIWVAAHEIREDAEAAYRSSFGSSRRSRSAPPGRSRGRPPSPTGRNGTS